MRIVIAGQLPPPIGGQNIAIARLIERLNRVRELSPELEIDSVEHWEFGFTRAVSEVRRFRFGKAIEVFRCLWRLLKIRAGGPIDLVIYPTGGTHGLAMIRDVLLLPFAKVWSREVAVHFHAAGIADRWELLPTIAKGFLRVVHRGCSAIVMTNYGRADPVALGITEIAVIPNAVANPALGSVATAGRTTLLVVGHLCVEKGTPDLLAAFAAVREAHPDLHLRLVGECLPNFPEDEFDSQVGDLGLTDHVAHSGVLTGADLAEAYREADAFVFSSCAPYESFGLVLVEAMSYSLPILATDWRANREVLGGDESSYCAVGETGLTEGLSWFLSERAEWPLMAAHARARYLECYPEERVTEKWIQWLEGHKKTGARP